MTILIKYLVDYMGVGVSVVNALSNKLILQIFRENQIYELQFSDGNTVVPLKK